MIKITRLGCDYLGMPEYGLINMLIKVAVAGPFEKGLDYIYPFDHPAILYTRVIVPLARREVIGIIIDVDITTTHSPQKLKKVIFDPKQVENRQAKQHRQYGYSE